MQEGPQLLRMVVVALVVARAISQWILEFLNQRQVRRHSSEVPEPFRGEIESAVYQKSVAYTLAQSRLSQFEIIYDAILLGTLLFSGILPRLLEWIGPGTLNGATYLFSIGLFLAAADTPFSAYRQFKLEARFGFNNNTAALWWTDRLKGLGLALILGGPLLFSILVLAQSAGDLWWLWAFACIAAFQWVLVLLAPKIILPLFNKFKALPDGALRDRLLGLVQRTNFPAQKIQVMDGSRRSNHSNAFFVGLGKGRKIVLFDTLIAQLNDREMEAVVAHEIGHYKKHHIPLTLLFSAGSLFLALYAAGYLSTESWFFSAFGFKRQSVPGALLLLSLLTGLVGFWFLPLRHALSCHFEYQADAYAAATLGNPDPLISALHKLTEKNLGNLTPAPCYAAVYYSHPPLLERQRALRAVTERTGA